MKGLINKIKEVSFTKVAAFCLAVLGAGLAKADSYQEVISSEAMKGQGLRHEYVADMTEALVRAGMFSYDKSLNPMEANYQLRIDLSRALAKLYPEEGWEDYRGTLKQNWKLRRAMMDGKLEEVLNLEQRIEISAPERIETTSEIIDSVSAGLQNFGVPEKYITKGRVLDQFREIYGDYNVETALRGYGLSIDDLLSNPNGQIEEPSELPELVLYNMSRTYKEEAEVFAGAYKNFSKNQKLNNSSKRMEVLAETKGRAKEEVRDMIISTRHEKWVGWSKSFLENKEIHDEVEEVYQRVIKESKTLKEARARFSDETGFGSRKTIVDEYGKEAVIVDVINDPAFRSLGDYLKEKNKTRFEKVLDDVDVGFSTTFAKDYVAAAGPVIGEGPVNQSKLEVAYKNLTGFVWTNLDIGDGEFHEVDYGFSYRIPILDKDGHAVDLSLGLERWEYPSGLLGNHNNVAKLFVNYRGVIDVNAGVIHLFEEDDFDEGDHFRVGVSRSFGIYEGDKFRVSVRPGIKASYLNDFLGMNGLNHITPNVGVSLDTKKIGVDGYTGFQIGIGDNIDDKFYWGLSFRPGRFKNKDEN